MRRIAFLSVSVLIGILFLVNACKKKEEEFNTPCSKPTPAKAYSNGPIGVGGTLQLTAESISGASYSWTGPNGFSSTSQNPSVSFTSAAAGTYAVTITVDECTSDPYYVYVEELKTTASSNSPVIMNQTLTLFGGYILDNLGQAVAATYSWTGPNGFTSSVQNPTITAVPIAAAGTYSCVASANGFQSAVSTVTVEVIPPAVSFITNNSPSVGGVLTFSTQTIAGASYSWTGPNGFSSTVQNPSVSNITRKHIGMYTVTYTLSGVPSQIKQKYVYVKFSNSGCNGVTTFTLSGKTYNVVEVGGTQCWMKENLIKTGTRDRFMYTEMMPAPTDSQGVCPTGWHLPTSAELQNLAMYAGNNGNDLKKVGQGTGSGVGTDLLGFSAVLNINLAGGKKAARYWSNTESTSHAQIMQLNSDTNYIYTNLHSKTDSAYVRCVMD
ncbi:MAG: PKD domain-containing protein [Bacteroidetes bacterium]|nr:PKD domain-containing protein [Bacteroidota bacterium]